MTRIAIIGGGIGGLVAGIALRNAGLDPVIYERTAEFGEVGAGISLSPNAVKGLESLGMGQFLALRANEPLDQFQHHGLTGELLLRIDRRTCRATYGAAYYQMHRADLLAELARRFGADRCQFSKQLVRASEASGAVTLHFADGTSAVADAVIGADGLRSSMRDILFNTPPPVFSRHIAWRALIPANRLPPEAAAASSINHISSGKNLVTYPVRGTELVNMVALTRSPDWVEESWSAKAAQSTLAAEFAGWTDFVIAVVAAVSDEDLYRWGLFVRTPLDHWAKGRMALLGDAAHPMLPYMGQGASSAIEDGVVLGRCFGREADPQRALQIYQSARVERAAFLQEQSNLGGDRLQALDPYVLRDNPPQHEDALGIFRYDPVTAPL